MTTDREREKMRQIIGGHTQGGTIDWSASAADYFAWRSSELGTKPISGKALENAANDIGTELKRDAQASMNRLRNQEADRNRKFKSAAEAAVKARLIDPGSAQFEWPYGFIYGTWKPFLARRVSGYWTCGRVNARNRMGGYAGSAAFVVVLDDNGVAEFVDVAEGKYPIVETQCSKSASLLPPAPPEFATAESSLGSTPVADEIEKLARLRDRGIITPAEFDAQKAKLLGER
jgi:hypothetical protein